MPSCKCIVKKLKYKGAITDSEYEMLMRNLSAVEVKRGKWAEKEVMYIKDTKDAIDAWQSCRCSECGRYDTRPYMYFFSEPRFCSYCGADMREEAEDGKV